MATNDLRRKRQTAERRGHVSEVIAAAYLLLKGYRIVALRHRTRLGEIDIIARKRDLIILVEVKARTGEQAAVDAVGHATQTRIRAAGDLWLARQTDHARLSVRYDIVAVVPGRWPRHFKDAF